VAAIAAVLILSVRFVGEDEVLLVGSEEPKMLGPGINLVVPFSPARSYPLSRDYVLDEASALRVELAGGGAVVECRVRIGLDPGAVVEIDRRYGREFFTRLVVPLLEREVGRIAREAPNDWPAGQEQAVVAAINGKTAPLGITVERLELGPLVSAPAVSHDLERSDGVKVFILGLDAYDWIVVDRVAAERGLPHINRIREEGAWGDLRSMEPLISPLIWTTMVTGVTPDVHGITDFLVRDESTGEDIPVTSWMRMVPALWNITSLFDLTCGFIGWFASFPAEQVNGFIVTDRVAYHMFDPGWEEHGEGSGEGMTYPAGLYDRISPLLVEPASARDRLPAYIEGPVGDVPSGFDPENPASSLLMVISAYRSYWRMMKELYPDRRPGLFGIYFEFTDSIGHLFMRHMDPPMSGIAESAARRYGQAMYTTYEEADRIIGDVLEMLDEDTVLMVVSDHGFKSGLTRPRTDSRIGHGQAIEWHRINGAIALYGSIVKRGYHIEDAGVMDIAPTVLYLLGLPVDRRMEGRILTEALKEEWVRDHPVVYTSAYDSLIVQAVAPGTGSSGDQALKDKLVSLGYVAGGSSSLINLANFYHRNGRFQEALEMWSRIVSEDPNDLGARIGMSNAYFELGNTERAISELREVLRRDRRTIEAHQSLATIYVRLGEGDRALAAAEDGLAVDPQDGQSHFNRGLALDLLGRTEEAAHEYRQALKFSPDLAEAYVNLAQIYLARGRKGEALEMAERGADLASGRPQIQYVLGITLEANGRPEEAYRRFIAAITIDPDFAPAYVGACGSLLSRGRRDSVITLCEEALKSPSGYEPHLRNLKGMAHAGLGDLESAEREFRAALEAGPGFHSARINLARVYVEEGRRSEAARLLRAVLDADPGNRKARNLLESLPG
jgi:tetratricopeptide (TPR) repeat protein